jgi:dihydroneopterin aldolase
MRILIEDLTFTTVLGILPEERTTPQRVRIDCIIDYAYNDGYFINYAEVADRITQTMHDHRFELIETALNVLASTLKKNFPRIDVLNLTIRKPDILTHCTVGVQQNFIF